MQTCTLLCKILLYDYPHVSERDPVFTEQLAGDRRAESYLVQRFAAELQSSAVLPPSRFFVPVDETDSIRFRFALKLH